MAVMNQRITSWPVITSEAFEQKAGPEVAEERLQPLEQITGSRPLQHSLGH